MQEYINSMQAQRIQKLITFSPQLYELIEQKVSKLGVSFPEYIRSLAVNDVKRNVEFTSFLTHEEEEGVKNSLADIRAGRYIIVRTDEEIEKHLQSLVS